MMISTNAQVSINNGPVTGWKTVMIKTYPNFSIRNGPFLTNCERAIIELNHDMVSEVNRDLNSLDFYISKQLTNKFENSVLDSYRISKSLYRRIKNGTLIPGKYIVYVQV